MAIATGTIAAIAAATSAVAGISSGLNAKAAAGKSAEAQRNAQDEQRANQARQAAEEQRKQVREERVRRARILQSSENTGVSGSSGELGAIGSLATQFSTNLGSNAGAKQSGQAISAFAQQAADFGFQAQQSQADAQMFNQISGMAGSIFNATQYIPPKSKVSIPSASSSSLTTADYMARRDQ